MGEDSVYENYLGKALNRITIADHMLTMTYPLIKDPKILITVLNNIFEGCIILINSIAKAKHFKEEKDADSSIISFKMNIAKSCNVPSKYISLIDDLKSILKRHKSSAVEMRKKENFIMFDENYHIKKLNTSEVRRYLDEAKDFYNFSKTLVEDAYT